LSFPDIVLHPNREFCTARSSASRASCQARRLLRHEGMLAPRRIRARVFATPFALFDARSPDERSEIRERWFSSMPLPDFAPLIRATRKTKGSGTPTDAVFHGAVPLRSRRRAERSALARRCPTTVLRRRVFTRSDYTPTLSISLVLPTRAATNSRIFPLRDVPTGTRLSASRASR
jgi:hypothetical protein